jgi:hypothetical protein
MGEWLAGVFGVALLALMFADWYSVAGGRVGVSAWEAFSVTDVLIALAAVMAVALAVITASDRSQAVSVALASLLTIFSLIALVFLLYRVISPPDVAATVSPDGPRPTGYIPQDVKREAGLWLGLAAYAGLLAGALAALRDDRFPRAVREQSRVEVETLPTPPREGAGESRA